MKENKMLNDQRVWWAFIGLISALLMGFIAITTSGCTTGEPKITKINGVTMSQQTEYFCGIPVGTKEKEYKTQEQKEADIDIKRQENQAKIEAGRGWFAMFTGGVCLIGAIACAFVAYLTNRWKRWTGLGLICGGSCALCWGMVAWIPSFKWLLIVPVGALLYFLWEHKDFHLSKWLKDKKSD